MIKYLYVVGEGGELVDTVEYDDAQSQAPAVAEVMSALNVSADEARDMVAKANPGAELTSGERARQLAEQIAAREVPDRGPETYGGYTGALSVTEEKPRSAMTAAMITKEGQ